MKTYQLNLNAARKRLSVSTGFVHACYEQVSSCETIPIFENFCYALALLRSKNAENVAEAAQLIERLLPFEVEGNFPVYLHEYPQLRDRCLPLRLLPMTHFVLSEFATILAPDLRKRLEGLMGRLLSSGYKLSVQNALSPPFEWVLKAYFEPNRLPDIQPQTLQQWSELVAPMQMAAQRGANIQPLLDRALTLWHPELQVYVAQEKREGPHIAPTLFDLFVAFQQGQLPPRLLEDHPTHLCAALIQPLEHPLNWQAHPIPLVIEQADQPLAIYWGTNHVVHTLSCEAKRTQAKLYQEQDQLELRFTLAPTFTEESAMEIDFFLNLHPDHQFSVDGRPATTFHIGQPLEIRSKERAFSLKFELLEGEGDFLGHLLQGNRSTQALPKEQLRMQAYDWQISLRTLRRSAACTLRAMIIFS